MTERQRHLIRESFASLSPEAGAIGLLFYGRLFALDPALRPMFHGDIGRQSKKLRDMLAVVIRYVDDLESLGPELEALGQRHVGYGVRDEHYASVGAALEWAIAQALEVELASEVMAAWRALIGQVAARMLQGAAAPAAPPLPR